MTDKEQRQKIVKIFTEAYKKHIKEPKFGKLAGLDKKEEIIKNAHCKYFEGQTGLCQAKEFKRCNPIKCKLYTIDELSTILDLQKQLQRKEQECEKYKTLLMQKDEVNALMDGLGQIWNSDPCEICTYKQDYQRLANQYNAVVEQNKQLQTELNEIKKDIEVGIFCITCKKENENDKLRVEYEKYKKCLNEIKSIAQNACNNCQECTTEFNLQTSCEYYEILKIINEVESE